jgi:hypothetical protein
VEDDNSHLLQTKKKPTYPINPFLTEYLVQTGREMDLMVSYERLLQFSEAAPLYDVNGEDTLWLSTMYPSGENAKLRQDLTRIYAILKAGGNLGVMDHLYCDRIDFCTFGNSQPFRIRIVNSLNDNQDYYYIKRADASRIYGLELEDILSPNRIHFLTDHDTLVEEHIIGIPGDVFIDEWMDNRMVKTVRLAKELVKFNQRCFVRLLGDMRSYNFVVDLTPDFEEAQIRIRSMDFDQQSYSGRLKFYLPQFFKENLSFVQYTTALINPVTARQYELEEHAGIYRRMRIGSDRYGNLLHCMRKDALSTPEKVHQLREELADFHREPGFSKCRSMGDLLDMSLTHMCTNLEKELARQRKTHAPFPFDNQTFLNLGGSE